MTLLIAIIALSLSFISLLIIVRSQLIFRSVRKKILDNRKGVEARLKEIDKYLNIPGE